MSINSDGWAQIGMQAASAWFGVPAGGGSSGGGKGGSVFGGPNESNAFSNPIGSGLDGSGWAINFGSGALNATSTQAKPIDTGSRQAAPMYSPPPDTMGLPFTGGSNNQMLPWLALGGLALVAVWRLKR